MFFKKKKIVLDCYTDDPATFKLAQPKPATAFMPQWWKDLSGTPNSPVEENNLLTVKRCYGVHELVKRSIAVPMWCDLAVELGPIGSNAYQYRFAGAPRPIINHEASQRGSYLDAKRYQHLKIVSPWRFKCAEDVHWMVTQATWSFEHPDEVFIHPGVVDFKYQHDVNFNTIFVHKEKPYTQTFPFGQAMVYVTPIDARKVELRMHLVTKEEMFALTSASNIKFFNNHAAVRKASQEARGGSCPMGFGN